MIEVEPTDAMGPWRLRKHINLRHIPAGDYRSEGKDKDGRAVTHDITELSIRKCYRPDDAATRAFHDYCHRTFPERYDHEH